MCKIGLETDTRVTFFLLFFSHVVGAVLGPMMLALMLELVLECSARSKVRSESVKTHSADFSETEAPMGHICVSF